MGKDIKDFGRRIQSKVIRTLGAEKNKFLLRKKRVMEFRRPALSFAAKSEAHLRSRKNLLRSRRTIGDLSCPQWRALCEVLSGSLSLNGSEAFCFSR